MSKLVKVRELNVRQVDDGYNCIVTGMDFLSDGKMVVVDGENFNVKLLDADGKCLSTCKVLYPRDVAIFGEQENIAVTQPTARKIHFLSPAKAKLEEIRCFEAEGMYSGILYNGEHLIAADITGNSIDWMTLDCTVQKSTVMTSDGGSLDHVALGKDKQSIYVAESENGVFLVRSDETVKNICRDFKKALALTVDGVGYIYVCDETGVVQLDPDGTKTGVCLTKEDKIQKASGIWYNKYSDTLFLANMAADFQNTVVEYRLQ